jgi:hypothetical protein
VGHLDTFRCGFGRVNEADGGVLVDEVCAGMLDLTSGEEILHVAH